MQDYREEFSLATKDLWISAVTLLKAFWRFFIAALGLIMNPTPNEGVAKQATDDSPPERHHHSQDTDFHGKRVITEEQAVACYEQFLFVHRGDLRMIRCSFGGDG